MIRFTEMQTQTVVVNANSALLLSLILLERTVVTLLTAF